MLIVEEKNNAPYRSMIVPINRIVKYCSGGASITKNGNLKLGELTIQRNGGARTAQMLQFKFSPKGVFDMSGVDIVQKSQTMTSYLSIRSMKNYQS